MHIEPGIVNSGKMLISYATALSVFAITVKLSFDCVRRDGMSSLLIRSLLAIVMVLCFFEVFPRYPIGVSEVHLILGTTIYLLFGTAPAAIGLVGGLLAQKVYFLHRSTCHSLVSMSPHC
jgi:ABC-type Co2+ transport system permease subunit